MDIPCTKLKMQRIGRLHQLASICRVTTIVWTCHSLSQIVLHQLVQLKRELPSTKTTCVGFLYENMEDEILIVRLLSFESFLRELKKLVNYSS